MTDTDARLALIHDWLSRELHLPQVRIEVASSDASFRRYFRASSGTSTYIVMDAPPEKENVRPYLKEFLIGEALSQPRVFVHRDYHARNLMVVGERNPGIIDFQDALCGPVGYDLVSLLKDCYIAWPRARVVSWMQAFRTRLLVKRGPAGGSEAEFLRWFDLIGVQRHIKVLGIFCRLWYRDGKPGYLPDLPRTLDYVRETSADYAELAPLARFLEERVTAQLPRANERIAADRRARTGARP